MNHVIGKTFVISGATSGIGLAVAEGLVKQEGLVIGIGRTPESCDRTTARLRALHTQASLATVLCADLSLQSNVRRVAKEISQQLTEWNHTGLDVLINNAATVPFWQTYTPEGFDLQWAVNHLAPFLLTHEVLPLLKAAPQARVVTISSASHFNSRLDWSDIQLRKHYQPLRAYQQSKLANVLFTVELNRQLGTGSSVRAFAADPGLVNTEIGLKSNSWIARWIWDIRRRGGVPAEQSARGIIQLATEPSIHDSHEIYWKNGLPVKADPNALDHKSASRLWEISAQMCGLTPLREETVIND
jgi:NAD(P)-dependent dehydrogenase (short-subunit alcohol dehydrogenase family)